MAMTGFIGVLAGRWRAAWPARHPGRNANRPPLRVTTSIVLPDTHRRRRDRRAVGGQAQQRLAVLRARTSAPALGVAEDDRCGRPPAARSGRGTAALSLVQATSPVARAPGGDAVARRRRRRPARRRRRCASVPPTLLASRAACRARRRRSRPRPGTSARRPRRRRARPGRPGRPGARPRWCRAAWPRPPPSARVPRSGSTPARRGALADQQRVLERAEHAGLRQRQRLAGALQRPQLAAVERIEGLHGAVDAHHEDPLAGHQRRGRHARRRARCATSTWPRFERDQFVVARDHGGEAAVAADAGARAARRRWRARARGRCSASQREHACRRSPATVNAPSPLTSTATSGNSTLADAAGSRPGGRAICGAIGSSGVGLGLSACPSRPPSSRRSSRAAPRPAPPAARTPARRLARRVTSPLGAAAARGAAPSAVSLASTGGGTRPSGPSPSRPSDRPPCASSFLPCASRTSPRRSATSASNSLAVARVELLQRLVVLLLVEQQAGQAQARDRLVLVLARRCRPTQASVGPRGVDLALVELRPWPPAGRPAAVKAVRGKRSFMSAKTRAGLVGVAGLRGAVELVVHRAGLDGLVALPPVPAVPGRIAAEHDDQQPR